VIVLNGQNQRLEQVLFAPNGTDVLAPARRGTQAWRPFQAGGAPQLLPVKFPWDACFTPDGTTLYVTNSRLWRVDYATGAVSALTDRAAQSLRFALARAGDRYLFGEAGAAQPYFSMRVADGQTIWHRPGGDWWGHPLFLPGDAEFVGLVVEGANRRERKFRIVTYDAATGEERGRSNPLAGESVERVVSPDGALLACRVTVWVHVYPLREPFTKPLATLRNDNRKEFTDIAFHPSGKYLAAASNDATIKLYDTSTWAVARTFTWDIGRMRSVAFSPDGTLAAAGSDKGKVVVWDVDL
jgi:WD40 repeat protein